MKKLITNIDFLWYRGIQQKPKWNKIPLSVITMTIWSIPAGNYLLKVNNRTKWRRSGAFIVNFEHISHFAIVFLLLTLNM